ncbi:hypothetical protein MKW94_009266 [Papaver nudicaule]|uniref:RRM Nup35-type domain-containing protein n=1 Tax=Papaver nudicaule TaxID=74823 RepID=A0AA42AW48_PAPNU|nr:hypothetical protein [Papaver nudicaule]
MHTLKSVQSSNFSTHTKTILNFPKSEKLADANSRLDDVKPNIIPLKPEDEVKPEPLAIIHPAENLSEEEWVTVYGFTNRDRDAVLQEFGQCGIILDYDTSGNWIHILYQNHSGAQQALSKSGKAIKRDVLVGVKPVDSFVISDLNGRKKICSLGSDDRIKKALCAETGNVYNVTVSTSPSSRYNCPDNTVPCKHILFVFLRVLGVSQDDSRIWRKSLLPCELTELHNIPTPVHTLACARVRHEFERLLSTSEVKVGPSESLQDEDVLHVKCHVCHSEMHYASEAVECGSCRDMGHKRCMKVWRKRKAGKINVCACCSEELISAEHNWYTNLRDYMD